MPNRITRAALLFASSSLFLVTAAFAQDKAAPKVMERTTSSAEAKAALTTAIEEVVNIGGNRRYDPKLKAVIAADPNFGLGRAWYAGWGVLTPAERNTEFARALKDAAGGSTAELIFIAGLRESRAGRNDVARQLLDVVLTLTPDDPDVAFARLLIAANDAERLRLAEAGVSRFPDYAAFYNILAYAQNTAGQPQAALQSVAKYVSLNPTHPNPHDSYAEILQLNGQYDPADTHYVHAIEKDPAFDEALVGRAEIAVLRGQYSEARPHLAQALAMATTPARKQVLQRQVAATFLYERKLKDAKAVLTSVVTEGEASSVNVLPDKRTLAFIALHEGKTTEATALYAAGTPPTAAPTLPLSDAIFHALLKHPEEVSKAVAAMEASAASAPANADAQAAARAARVIDAVAKNDLAAARAAHQRVTGPAYRALSGAFVLQLARKAGDRKLAETAALDVEAYKAVNANAAFARMIAKRK